jgi:2-polyprenyl-3-methyl-5-hydroxy-6-metoxy-1,4-benzoquinol methylase
MDPAYALEYRTLHHTHWWWRAREDFLVERIRELSPAGGFGPILDVGCGDGLFFEALSQFGAPEGVESDPSTMSAAAERFGMIHRQPFDDAFHPGRRYGLVLMLDVVEHLADDRACLARGAELLAPGGLLLATVPAFQALWTSHDRWNHHYRRYSRDRFAGLVAATGVEILAARYFFHWPAPVKLLVRLKEWLARTEPSLPATPAPLINRMLYWLSRLEALTVGRLDLPFGSSLFVVARKSGQPEM